jgi:hypothetical protein
VLIAREGAERSGCGGLPRSGRRAVPICSNDSASLLTGAKLAPGAVATVPAGSQSQHGYGGGPYGAIVIGLRSTPPMCVRQSDLPVVGSRHNIGEPGSPDAR